jgi:hypothetical protein
MWTMYADSMFSDNSIASSGADRWRVELLRAEAQKDKHEQPESRFRLRAEWNERGCHGR